MKPFSPNCNRIFLLQIKIYGTLKINVYFMFGTSKTLPYDNIIAYVNIIAYSDGAKKNWVMFHLGFFFYFFSLQNCTNCFVSALPANVKVPQKFLEKLFHFHLLNKLGWVQFKSYTTKMNKSAIILIIVVFVALSTV